MAEKQLEVTEFVRGMIWHDVGKPFALGTAEHIWLGYWLLKKAGYLDEALVALMHGVGEWENTNKKKDQLDKKCLKRILEDWFNHYSEPIPAILLMTHPLDLMAASFYSLLGRMVSLGKFKGGKEKNPLFHTWQNPFSRLPLPNKFLAENFMIRDSQDEAQVPHSREEQLDLPLRNRFYDTLNDKWKSLISSADLDAAKNPTFALTATPAPVDGQALLQTLEAFLYQYPERTYPSANDTTLMEHTRLSGVLAFALYRNLEKKGIWLHEQIINQDGHLEIETAKKVEDLIKDSPEFSGDDDIRKSVCENLDASLVRIAFEGHRRLFESAVRVDDLLGARELTRRFLDAFEEALAHQLGVPGLLWSSQEDERKFLLTINRNQFELFYLLPPHPAPDSEMTITEVVNLAYEAALKEVIKDLIKELRQDFRRAVNAGVLSFGPAETQDLHRQLRELSYRLRVMPLHLSGEIKRMKTFAQFTSKYGRRLVRYFRDSLDYAAMPYNEWPEATNQSDELRVEQTCTVSGNHPVFQPLARLLTDEKWGPYVQKVTHQFRGEQEQPCLAVIAQRILAHGRVAQETEALQKMVSWADDLATPPRRLIIQQPEGGPDLPPAMVRTRLFNGDDDFVDLGAAFARYRRQGDGVRYDCPPQLFPTTDYAADANSNIVLLALQPTQALYETYQYGRASASLGSLPEEIRQGERIPLTDREKWQASFALLHQWVVRYQNETIPTGYLDPEEGELQPKTLAESMATVRPHLARVVERIRYLKDFYRALKQALDAARLRVLPLDVNFPTLRLLLPADQLDETLQVLDKVMTETLFSATYPPKTGDVLAFAQARHELHCLLAELTPSLLHGAAIVFKQKYPLYLVLEAERNLFRQLVASDIKDGPGRRKYLLTDKGQESWYGLRLAFSDLRGTLSQVGPTLAEVTYADLGEVLALAKAIDRRTVNGRANILNAIPADKPTAKAALTRLADDLTLIRAKKLNQLEPVKALLADQEKKYQPVHFIKMATRE